MAAPCKGKSRLQVLNAIVRIEMLSVNVNPMLCAERVTAISGPYLVRTIRGGRVF